MSKIELEDRGRALEEVFFQKEQARLLEAMHSKKRRNDVIEALSDATGLDDRGTLGLLADLGVRAGSLAARPNRPPPRVPGSPCSMRVRRP